MRYMSDKDYFKRALPFHGLYKCAFREREKIFDIFIDRMKPLPDEKVIDIGAFAGSEDVNQNVFEKLYPYASNITAVGIEDASFLERQYPGLKFVKVAGQMRCLPFDQNQFDLGFSNATIEHVGSNEKQRFFMQEAIRVCKRLFIVTPNRFYPLEFHTLLPFIHWLPKPVFRTILRILKLEFYSKEMNLNLLSKREFMELVPEELRRNSSLIGFRFLGLVSNLILVIYKKSIC